MNDFKRRMIAISLSTMMVISTISAMSIYADDTVPTPPTLESGRLLGDVNKDGKISTADVGLANSHAKSIKILADEDFKAADVNYDGEITTADVGRINSHVKGVRLLDDTNNPSDSSSQENIPPKVGDEIWFSERPWTILDIQDGKALILSEYSILTNEEWYNQTDNAPITWETCSLRQYLNGEFFNEFTIREREKILETIVINDDNPDYGTDGGNNTNDKIFLLSIAETEKYINLIPEDVESWSWLRSPGASGEYAAALYASGERMEIATDGFLVTTPRNGIVKYGAPGYGYYPRVRPACWIKLD